MLVYHNPRCSKCRQLLALLESNHVDYEVVEYLKSPLTREQLRQLVNQLGDQLARSKPDTDLVDWLLAHPEDMQRPVVVRGGQAIIARPPEKVLEFLSHPDG
ncbi:MAG: ArsC/Spx/MgsR family protein [Vulcanimicrobiota bacterium]